MHRPSVRFFFAVSLAMLLFAAFLKLSSEFREGEVEAQDRKILTLVVDHRRDWANPFARGVSNLGSPEFLGILMLIAVPAFHLFHRRRESRYLAAGAVGAAVLTLVLKPAFSRPRPSIVPHLSSTTGYSFPSGHSLGSATVFLLLTFFLSRRLESRGARLFAVAAGAAISAAVGASRVYLGAHFPSDVASGLFLGAAWAFLLEGLYLRGPSPTASSQD